MVGAACPQTADGVPAAVIVSAEGIERRDVLTEAVAVGVCEDAPADGRPVAARERNVLRLQEVHARPVDVLVAGGRERAQVLFGCDAVGVCLRAAAGKVHGVCLRIVRGVAVGGLEAGAGERGVIAFAARVAGNDPRVRDGTVLHRDGDDGAFVRGAPVPHTVEQRIFRRVIRVFLNIRLYIRDRDMRIGEHRMVVRDRPRPQAVHRKTVEPLQVDRELCEISVQSVGDLLYALSSRLIGVVVIQQAARE